MRAKHNIHGFIQLTLIAVLALSFLACSGGDIKPSRPIEIIETLRAELNASGFSCRKSEGKYVELICKHAETYETLIHYYPKSRRIRFMSLFSLKRNCDEIHSQIVAFNWSFNVAQTSCNKKVLAMVATTLTPEAGFNGLEIKRYLLWWRSEINHGMKQSGLWDLVE